MEQMHSLESSLPPEQPPTKQAIESLNLELSQEFKLAANAVTRLYRVANEKNSLTKHQGYLTCLDDILCALDSNVTADELRAWCYKRRNDILSNSQDKSLNPVKERERKLNKFSENQHRENEAHKEPFEKDSAVKYNFSFNESNVDLSNINENIAPKFRLSMPPLSVEHPPRNASRIKSWKARTINHGRGDTRNLNDITGLGHERERDRENTHYEKKPKLDSDSEVDIRSFRQDMDL
ncbi:CPA_1a_G0030550.mRNA.1.CDS.1 [Saccharomyces cerevisiae]|nr:hypothetical protein H810_YJM1399J00271 [Saccharomyces cerevisiae YJM1399]CAI4551370.1 CPA_1a_G0030550.mRNA.1.CDS.1 [Saccharomyces cerevisiae]CAI4565416.1 BBM_1a_G0030020.mRNA.1.CDS.1 [Saccharomyces cerevisiae]CAI4565939.1 ADE_G0029860.mRNA.1.CDS.1 [Saccharomyces cerevisiae]CAI6742847.1 ADE_G0029860.mRNA.1.CDS.1 [Saccharomyces cerevisiae]